MAAALVHGLAARLRGTGGSRTQQLALLVACRHTHAIRAPGVPWKIYHPSIQEPERTVKLIGSPEGPSKYVPRNFRHQQFVEAIRSGEYLGQDWPYNFLSSTFWKDRRYNATYNPIPPDMSCLPGILFIPKQNVWSVEWYEQRKQRIKWFLGNFGFMRAKHSAESFRRALVQAGRVDNMRTEREARLQQIAAHEARSLFKKKFRKKDARRTGNSGSKLGPERRMREDYRRRGLLP
mmetsp:Transcript_41385/g.95913  ORF Transcript_41385/g.95913 Transcript_41385/m.95913 type:complete len:235 (-) Transcript_41385:50-754(-)